MYTIHFTGDSFLCWPFIARWRGCCSCWRYWALQGLFLAPLMRWCGDGPGRPRRCTVLRRCAVDRRWFFARYSTRIFPAGLRRSPSGGRGQRWCSSTLIAAALTCSFMWQLPDPRRRRLTGESTRRRYFIVNLGMLIFALGRGGVRGRGRRTRTSWKLDERDLRLQHARRTRSATGLDDHARSSWLIVLAASACRASDVVAAPLIARECADRTADREVARRKHVHLVARYARERR